MVIMGHAKKVFGEDTAEVNSYSDTQNELFGIPRIPETPYLIRDLDQ
jgi:hypothetical protein